MKETQKEYTPMMQQYLALKEQYPDTLLFFRLGDFYEMFFSDAVKTSKMLEITLTSRAAGGKEKIPMCGVPYHAAHGYIQRLVDMGEKIAIAEQTSEPQKGKTLVTREVTKIITPGTFVQEGMFEAEENCYVAACIQDGETFSICYGDISIGKYFYIKNLKSTLEVIDFLRVLKPLEVVVLENEKTLFADIYVYLTVGETTIPRFNRTERMDVEEKAKTIFGLLETYLLSIREDSMLSFQGVEELKYESYMYMSAATVASLELFETIKTRNKEGSLLSLLDVTKTALGTRQLRHWLANPLLDKEQINERQDVVSTFIDQYIERIQLQKILGKTYDLERLISRICSYSAQPRELHQLKQTLHAISDLEELVASEKFHPLVLQKWQDIGSFTFVREELNRALATEDVQTLKETGLFKAGYSEDLDELQAIANGGTKWLIELEQREKERTGIKNLRIKYNKVFGYFIEVSKGNAALVQEEWGYHRKQTLTNAERFVTEELKQKEEQILGANERLAQLEKQLFLDLCEKIVPFRLVLQKLADFIAWIDVLQSFAHVSQEYRYVRSTINEQQVINVKRSRHPIIEKVTGDTFIPNDISMNTDDVLLITGPNMAGKSTYMRQVAICAIMQQIGCFVPATVAELPIFDAIFTRIGAQDDLFSGESTFMVEMKEVSAALANATEKSLLLFDEIGRGTATYDGLALAYAILHYIQEHIHAKTLFSTHYHELTELVEEMETVRNVHVSATLQGDAIIFHHHIEEGSIERSYGVQVAQLAHLPMEVIKQAKELLVVLEENHPTIDATLVDDGHIQQVLDKQDKVEALAKENQELKAVLLAISQLPIDDMSPKQALEELYTMQNRVQMNLK